MQYPGISLIFFIKTKHKRMRMIHYLPHRACRIPLLAACSLLLPLVARAQTSGQEKHLFSAYTGAACYTGHLLGTAGPASGLRNGITWGVGYTYLIGAAKVKGGIGVLYAGNRYSNDFLHGSDRIATHYFAPQYSIHYFTPAFRWEFSMGCGYQLYADHSTVYQRPRKVTMNKLAGNFGLRGEYRLFRQWGFSAGISYILAFSDSYSVRYHGEEWEVIPGYRSNKENRVKDISQLSVSAGIHYHF